jgi:hypothetical protein
LPLEGRRWELLDGAVVRMEMHCARTSVFIGGLLFLIHQHTDGYVSPGGAWLIGFVVPENKTVMLFHPDIAPIMPKQVNTLEGEDVLPASACRSLRSSPKNRYPALSLRASRLSSPV